MHLIIQRCNKSRNPISSMCESTIPRVLTFALVCSLQKERERAHRRKTTLLKSCGSKAAHTTSSHVILRKIDLLATVTVKESGNMALLYAKEERKQDFL